MPDELIPPAEQAQPFVPQPEIVRVQSERLIHLEQNIGPMPAPTDMERYEQILPGAATRFFAAWDAEVTHRHARERDGQINNERNAQRTFEAISRGQTIFAGIVVVMMLCIVALGIWGNPWVAGVIAAFATLLACVAKFYGAKHPQNADK